MAIRQKRFEKRYLDITEMEPNERIRVIVSSDQTVEDWAVVFEKDEEDGVLRLDIVASSPRFVASLAPLMRRRAWSQLREAFEKTLPQPPLTRWQRLKRERPQVQFELLDMDAWILEHLEGYVTPWTPEWEVDDSDTVSLRAGERLAIDLGVGQLVGTYEYIGVIKKVETIDLDDDGNIVPGFRGSRDEAIRAALATSPLALAGQNRDN